MVYAEQIRQHQKVIKNNILKGFETDIKKGENWDIGDVSKMNHLDLTDLYKEMQNSLTVAEKDGEHKTARILSKRIDKIKKEFERRIDEQMKDS